MSHFQVVSHLASADKKWILSLMPAVIWLICACSPADKEALVFAVGGAPAEVAFWEELLGDFERQSGIRVEVLRQPADTDQRRQGLVIALNARKPKPDVFLMDIAWVGLFVASGWLEPLEGKMDAAPFFQRVIKMVDRHQGQLMALPVYVDGGILYYRRDLLERFRLSGPPSTWDVLSQALTVQKAMRETNPRFYGFVWQGAQYEGLVCNFMEFGGSEGGFILQEERLRLDTAANRTALAFMRDLIWRHRVSPPSTYTEMKEEGVRFYFQAGNALFERNWPYAWPLHQNPASKVKNRVGMTPLPSFPGGKPVSTLGGWHIGLSRFSEHKHQALNLIRFITSYDTQKNIMTQMGWNPGREDLYDDPDVLSRAPHYRELKDVFQNAQPRPLLPYYTQISAIVQRHINRVLAAYAITRLSLPGKLFFMFLILSLSMFPPVSLVGYLFKLMTALGWINTYPALILPYVAWTLPLSLWILVSYFSQIPRDLDRAGLVDGCSRMQILIKIIFPLAAPGIFATLLLAFIFAFNEFLFALLLTTDHAARTIPVGIALFEGLHGQIPWGEIMAAATLSTMPVVVLALIFQRRIIQGLTRGAVKE